MALLLLVVTLLALLTTLLTALLRLLGGSLVLSSAVGGVLLLSVRLRVLRERPVGNLDNLRDVVLSDTVGDRDRALVVNGVLGVLPLDDSLGLRAVLPTVTWSATQPHGKGRQSPQSLS